ncbi:MAG: hypothetical protein A2144_06895 [Chloroflexi bacterium RBG_16_50_9]|nr:MAG: hypothetical protein A2144_06895 [Chloroflexi bacterium RBG_16_50_9]
MSPEVKIIALLLHLLSMLFMAAPLYMLIIVNERARFNVPPGYNTDRYLENIIKRQPVRCYAYLTVILVTGILLVWARGWIWTDWALIVKLIAFVLLVGSLSYVHFVIQPHVERVLAGCKPGEEVPTSERPLLMSWRARRKRLSAVCLFLVLTSLIMGVRVTWDYAPWLAAIFMLVAALFAWRAYRKPVLLGWI